jgi:hypothetical protein
MTDSWIRRSTGSTIWSSREGNVSTVVTWTQTTRPALPFSGQTGLDTDFNGLETYNSTTSKWRIINGTWTSLTRPTTTSIDVGSQGFNEDDGYGLEMWNGSEWQLL